MHKARLLFFGEKCSKNVKNRKNKNEQSKNAVIMRFVFVDIWKDLSDNLIVVKNKTFFGGDVMEDRRLRGVARISNEGKDVLLEYYVGKKDDNDFYGLEIDESISKSDGKFQVCEKYVSSYDASDSNEIEGIADVFIKNLVTPTTADNVLHDLGRI